MSYAEEVASSRRLAILQALYFAPGYTLSAVELRRQVEFAGYITSMDKMAAELAWLAEMTLIELLELDVVRLNARGEDVAFGRSQTPGVRRPSPGGM